MSCCCNLYSLCNKVLSIKNILLLILLLYCSGNCDCHTVIAVLFAFVSQLSLISNEYWVWDIWPLNLLMDVVLFDLHSLHSVRLVCQFFFMTIIKFINIQINLFYFLTDLFLIITDFVHRYNFYLTCWFHFGLLVTPL